MDPRRKEYGSGDDVVLKAEDELLRQRLRLSWATAAKAHADLDRLRNGYMLQLGSFLVTYYGLEKWQFDDLDERNNNGRSYETREADAVEAVRKVEEECDEAWEEAIDAGITDMPLSPKDLGDGTEDGKTESQASEELSRHQRYYDDRRPRMRHWTTSFAKAGSPADPETGPQRSSAELTRLPSAGSSYADAGLAATPQRSQIDRHNRHKEKMRKRTAEQEAERLRAGEQQDEVERGPAKRRCIVL